MAETKDQLDGKAKNIVRKYRERMEKGLSLRSLLKQTPAYYKHQAIDYRVVLKTYSRKRTKGGMAAIVANAVSMENRPPRKVHKCSIIGLDKDNRQISTQRKVIVSCDCESFLFTFEYANWTWGASRIIYSNGEPAVVRNPANHPGLCKHLVVLAKTIIDQKD